MQHAMQIVKTDTEKALSFYLPSSSTSSDSHSQATHSDTNKNSSNHTTSPINSSPYHRYGTPTAQSQQINKESTQNGADSFKELVRVTIMRQAAYLLRQSSLQGHLLDGVFAWAQRMSGSGTELQAAEQLTLQRYKAKTLSEKKQQEKNNLQQPSEEKHTMEHTITKEAMSPSIDPQPSVHNFNPRTVTNNPRDTIKRGENIPQHLGDTSYTRPPRRIFSVSLNRTQRKPHR